MVAIQLKNTCPGFMDFVKNYYSGFPVDMSDDERAITSLLYDLGNYEKKKVNFERWKEDYCQAERDLLKAVGFPY